MGPFYASRIHHSTCPGSPGSPLPLLLRPLPLMLSLARRRGIPQSHLLPSDPCNKTVLLAPMFSPQSNQRTVPHKKRGTPRPKVTGRICAGMLMPHPTFNRHASRQRHIASSSSWSPPSPFSVLVVPGPAFGCGHWRSQTNNDGTAGPKAISAARFTSSPFRAMMCVHFDSRRGSRTKLPGEWMTGAGSSPSRAYS